LDVSSYVYLLHGLPRLIHHSASFIICNKKQCCRERDSFPLCRRHDRHQPPAYEQTISWFTISCLYPSLFCCCVSSFHFIITKISSILCLKKTIIEYRRFPVNFFFLSSFPTESPSFRWINCSSVRWSRGDTFRVVLLYRELVVLDVFVRNKYDSVYAGSAAGFLRTPVLNSPKMIVSCKCLNVQVETKGEPIRFDRRSLGGGYNTNFFSKVKNVSFFLFFKENCDF